MITLATVDDPAQAASPAADQELIAALRRGDEAAFARLVTNYHPPLLRLARSFVRDRAVAEEVVQETWLGVLRGLERFEGRSSLKTWIYRILINTAKKRAVREARSVPFSSLASPDDTDGGSVDADRFIPQGNLWAGHWAAPPASWGSAPEERLLATEARERIEAAIAALPDAQRHVMTLRDVDGWSSEEVCDLLELSEGNQRVLLHRARTKVRQALEEYFDESPEG